MKDISSVTLLEILPQNLRNNPDIIAASAALDSTFKELVSKINTCNFLSNTDNIDDENILNVLAKELKIDWYDETATIEVKRALINNSDKVYKSLGTKYAVEQFIKDYFGDGYVEEWFEYGGSPHHFKVYSSNPSITGDMADQFSFAIEKIKRASSILEEIVVDLTAESQIFIGNAIHICDYTTIEQVV